MIQSTAELTRAIREVAAGLIGDYPGFTTLLKSNQQQLIDCSMAAQHDSELDSSILLML